MDRLILFFPLLIIGMPLAFAESSNVGVIYWNQDIVSPNSFVDIYVKDNDMNKKELGGGSSTAGVFPLSLCR